MAYINGNEILFSAIVNSGNGDGDVNLDDVSVSNVAVNTAIAGGATGAGKGTILSVKLNAGDETRSVNYGMTTDPITADVIKKGTNILGVTGTLETVSGGIELDDVSVQSVAVNTAVGGGVTGAGKGTMLRVTLTDGEETKSANYGMTTDPITADVIKKGVNILGVTGTLEAGSNVDLESVIVESITAKLNTLTQRYDGVFSVNLVSGDKSAVCYFTEPNLIPANIAEGVDLFDMTGQHTGEEPIIKSITAGEPYTVDGVQRQALLVTYDRGTNKDTTVSVLVDGSLVIPENIKKGKTILGVQGGYAPTEFNYSRVRFNMEENTMGAEIMGDYVLIEKSNTDVQTQEQINDMEFGMKVVKYVKSNAICIVKNGVTLAIGGGQTSRVWALENAIHNNPDKDFTNSVLASDAFFPFSDCVQVAANAKISAIVQPGGSVRDQDSIDLCNELGIPMVFTGYRHFRH